MSEKTFDVVKHFGAEQVGKYDRRIRTRIPGYDIMHETARFLLESALPEKGKVLVVGAGTGQEVVSYAKANPGWIVTGVDPTPAMLALAAQRVESEGLAERVRLHNGYVRDLPPSETYHGATSMLVMHFLPDNGTKEAYLRDISMRLEPGAPFILVDLEGEKGSEAFWQLFAAWKTLLVYNSEASQIEEYFEHVLRNIQFVSSKRTEELLLQADFWKIQPFFKSLLCSGYVATKK